MNFRLDEQDVENWSREKTSEAKSHTCKIQEKVCILAEYTPARRQMCCRDTHTHTHTHTLQTMQDEDAFIQLPLRIFFYQTDSIVLAQLVFILT